KAPKVDLSSTVFPVTLAQADALTVLLSDMGQSLDAVIENVG
ncbi:hypothetical protein MGSAQ_003184, partial [marine sediment metagenome]